MIRIIASFIIFILFSIFINAANKTKPDYYSMKYVKNELQFIKNCWNDLEFRKPIGPVAPIGYVIVGRLNIPENAISSRIPIYNDGSYCTAICRGRKLFFFAHSYDPLEITPSSRIATNVYDDGLKTFKKAKPKDMRQLEAEVTARGANKKLLITCLLQIHNSKYLWQDHGYRCGSHVTVKVTSKKVYSGSIIKFKQLSRIPYVLVVTAPGYIKQELNISQTKSGTIKMGNINLIPAKKFNIIYRVRIRQKGGKWISDKSLKSVKVSCDGDSKFKFSNLCDGLGNSLELRMTPKKDIVEASFFYYKPNSFCNLGSLNIKDIKGWKIIDSDKISSDTKAILKNNNLYFFKIDDINGTEIELFFQVIEEKMPVI